MQNRLLKVILLLSLTFSVAWAKPIYNRHKKSNTFLDSTRMAVDVGVGLSVSSLMHNFSKYDMPINDKSVYISANPNLRLGGVCNYNSSLGQKFKLGPELGIHYGHRSLQVKSHAITISDHHLGFSLYIRSASSLENIPWLIGNIVLGYDMNVFLSSTYKQTGYSSDLSSSFHGDKDLYQYLSDLPRLSGSFVIGGGFEFPKGIYLLLQLKLPTEVFIADKLTKQKNSQEPQLDADFVMITRAFNSSLLELNMGMDILQFLKD